MGWGTRPRTSSPDLPAGGPARGASRTPATSSTSSSPQRVAELVARLPRGARHDRPGEFRHLRHNRIVAGPAPRCAAPGRPAAGRCCCLHGLGERSPAAVPDELASWPGPVVGARLHRARRVDVPAGGGYTCEILMADADAALAAPRPVPPCSAGASAPTSRLLIAGARPDLVRGAMLDDGPGPRRRRHEPGTPFILHPAAVTAAATPDPYALLELSHDLRPPDYAATFARQATTLSGLDVARRGGGARPAPVAGGRGRRARRRHPPGGRGRSRSSPRP